MFLISDNQLSAADKGASPREKLEYNVTVRRQSTWIRPSKTLKIFVKSNLAILCIRVKGQSPHFRCPDTFKMNWSN